MKPSSPLQEWLAKAVSQKRQSPFLEEALWWGEFGNYLRYRMRSPLVLRLLSTVAMTVELYLVGSVLPLGYLGAALAVTHLGSIISMAWWGGLESMRTGFGVAWARGERWHSKEWLRVASRFGFVAGVAVLLICLSAIAISSRRLPWVHIVHGYWLAAALRLAFDLPIQGITGVLYGARRVYRPPLAAPIVEVLLIVAPWFFFHRYGVWVFPVAAILAVVVRSSLGLFFLRRALRRLFPASRKPNATAPPVAMRFDAVQAGCYAFARTGGWMPLLGWLAAGGTHGLGWGPLLHSGSALMTLAGDWPFLFGPELRKAARKDTNGEKAPLVSALWRHSAFVGAGLGLLAVLAAGTIARGSATPMMLCTLVLLGIGRSVFGVGVVLSLAVGLSSLALALGVLTLAGLSISVFSTSTQLSEILALTLLFVLSGVWLYLKARRRFVLGKPFRRRSFAQWAARTVALDGAFTLERIRLETTDRRFVSARRQLAAFLNEEDYDFFWLTRDCCIVPLSAARRFSRPQIAVRCGGLVKHMDRLAPAATEALSTFTLALPRGAELDAEFARHFPAGWTLCIGRRPPREYRALSSDERRALWDQSQGKTSRQYSTWTAVAVDTADERRVYVVPSAQRAQLRAFSLHWNGHAVRMALASASGSEGLSRSTELSGRPFLR